MNIKKSLPYYLILIPTLLFAITIGTAFRGTQKNNKNNVSAKEKYMVDEKESVVTWKGSMQFITDAEHAGYVKISKGELMMQKGKLVGGFVEVDMNTIEDRNHESENGLINHLKSADFFDIENFPTSFFTITDVASDSDGNFKIEGNLTVKSITHVVKFPAKIDSQDGILSASGKLTIDRTKWDIRYRSGKFFENLADETISDSIEFELRIVAKKQTCE